MKKYPMPVNVWNGLLYQLIYQYEEQPQDQPLRFWSDEENESLMLEDDNGQSIIVAQYDFEEEHVYLSGTFATLISAILYQTMSTLRKMTEQGHTQALLEEIDNLIDDSIPFHQED